MKNQATQHSRPRIVFLSLWLFVCWLSAGLLPAQVLSGVLAFEGEGFDLETGAVVELVDPLVDSEDADFVVAYNSQRPTHAVILQLGESELALLAGASFQDVVATDTTNLPFTWDVVDQPCGSGDTVVIRTDSGSVYKIGNLVEDDINGEVAFDYELLSSPQSSLSLQPTDLSTDSSTARLPFDGGGRGRSVGDDNVPTGVLPAIRRWIESDRYAISKRLEGSATLLTASNPSHGYNVLFSDRGLELVVGGSVPRITMSLARWGYGERLSPVSHVRPRSSGQTVVYTRRGIKEWYVNRPTGLEHGFTVAERASDASADSRLRLDLVLSGAEAAQIAGDVIVFATDRGRVRYSGLKAWDAEAQELESRMSLDGRNLRIEVDDNAAVYPVTIDPTFIYEDAKLQASDGTAGTGLGGRIWNVDIDGDTIVVGTNSEPSLPSSNGAAYVFTKPVGGWLATITEVAKLLPSMAWVGDQFGISVAIDGDTIVVGSPGADSLQSNGHVVSNSGAAYVFEKPVGGWVGVINEVAKLVPTGTQSSSGFGRGLRISGSTVVGGVLQQNFFKAGSLYVFDQPVTGWSGVVNQAAVLHASDREFNDHLGRGKAISGDYVVGGAIGEDSNGSNSGKAYVWQRPAGGWSGLLLEAAQLVPSDGGTSDSFGVSADASGDTVVISATRDDAGGTNTGSVYVFERPAGGWAGVVSESAKLIGGGSNDLAGTDVAISGDGVVAGTFRPPRENPKGHILAWVKPAGGWSGTVAALPRLIASDGARGDALGSSVGVSGQVVVGGAGGDDDQGTNSGSAYVFTVPDFPSGNLPPACTATPTVSAECGGAVTTVTGLDGSGSSDPDGDTITYQWDTNCPAATWVDSTAATPTMDLESLTPGVCAPLSCTATLTVDDGAEESTCAPTTITVSDTQVPSITVDGDAAPTIQCAVDTFTDPGASASDVCDPSVSVTAAGSVDSSTVGSYPITYDANDACGNSATQATRTVSVVDTIAPVITTCAADHELLADESTGNAPMPDLVPEVAAADACSLAVTQDISAGTALSSGSYPTTLTATDGFQSAQCGATVTVLDRMLSFQEKVKVHFHDHFADDDGDTDGDSDDDSDSDSDGSHCFTKLDLDGQLTLRNQSTFPIDVRDSADTVAARVAVSLGGFEIADETVVLEVKDSQDEKWEYKREGSEPDLGLKKLKLDWKDHAEYDSHQASGLGSEVPQVATRFIGFDETDTKIEFKQVARPFTLDFVDGAQSLGITVLDANGTVTVAPTGDYDLKDKKDSLEIVLPFRLTPQTAITFTDSLGASSPIPVDPEVNYSVSSAKYMVDLDRTVLSDALCGADPLTELSSLSDPTLLVEIRLGSGIDQVVGVVRVEPPSWDKVDGKHWEAKP